jgi:hypothetical protein
MHNFGHGLHALLIIFEKENGQKKNTQKDEHLPHQMHVAFNFNTSEPEWREENSHFCLLLG